MDKIMSKAIGLITEAKNNEDFMWIYSENIVAFGENSIEYSGFMFDLGNEYFLFIELVDASFSDFCLGKHEHFEFMHDYCKDYID